MLLVIDVGNSHTVLGVYDDGSLMADWRVRTQKQRTADEIFVALNQLFGTRGLSFDSIEDTVIASVVPKLSRALEEFCVKYLGHKPLWIEAGLDLGMPILYDNPAEVGADRIVNAVAAYDKYHKALIIIDFGTATTFDCISGAGEYLGGAISPGIAISSNALFENAAKLPKVEITRPPDRAIGRSTVKSMQSGIILGYAGLVDGLVGRIKREMTDDNPFVIATGGLADLMADVSHTIESVEPDLTLAGLYIIYQRLKKLGDV